MCAKFFAQDYTLKEIPVRNADNTYLICSAPFVDKDGFVWYSINTEGVFYRFDGKNRIEYSMFDTERKHISVGDPNISNWFQDSRGNIWALNTKGAYIISPKTFKVKFIKWEPWKRAGYHRNYSSVTIKEDAENNIWITIGDYYLLKFDSNYKPIRLTDNSVDPEKGFLKIVKTLENAKILAKTDSNLIVFSDKKKTIFEKSKFYNVNKLSNFIENGKLFPKNKSGTYYLNDKPYPYKYIEEFDLQMLIIPMRILFTWIQNWFRLLITKQFIFMM